MTNQPLTKLQAAAKDIRLSDNERANMRATLHARMQAAGVSIAKPTPSPYTFLYMPRVAALALVPLILVLSAGGTAYAADDALPGDMLYPVKISVNEQVQSALAFSPTAKAQLHVALASKRMVEAQTLAATGRLDATTTAELQTNLEAHASQAQLLSQKVAMADPDEAAEIAAELNASLSANNAVLEDLGTHSKDENTRKDIKVLAAAVRTRVDAVSSVSNQVAGEDATTSPQVVTMALAPAPALRMAKSSSSTLASSSATTSAKATSTRPAPDSASVTRVGSRASTELARTVSLFKDVQKTLSSDSRAQVELQLATLQQMLDQGNASLQTGDTASASQNFTKVYAASVRLETLLKAAQRLGGNLIDPLLKLQVSLGKGAGQVLGTTTATTSVPDVKPAATTTANATTTVATSTSAVTMHAEEKKKKGSGTDKPQSILKKIFHAVME